MSPASSSTNNMESPDTQIQTPGSLKSLDVMLPKVCEALVLVTQCMVTVAIEAEENAVRLGLQEDISPKTNMKSYLNEARTSGVGVAECLIGEFLLIWFPWVRHRHLMGLLMCPVLEPLILLANNAWLLLHPELLRLLDKFLPRINFGRPVPPTGPSSNASSPSTPQGQGQAAAVAVDDHGFAYLKRDLVRLLGILCHETKAVQDRVREAGGIEVVMNMCVIDDRNPCKSVLSES